MSTHKLGLLITSDDIGYKELNSHFTIIVIWVQVSLTILYSLN